jgi:fused signal recognition particle receptor
MLSHAPKKRDKSFLARMVERLGKTRRNIVDKLREVISGRVVLDDDLLEEIEMILIQADVGVQTTQKIVERLRQRAGQQKAREAEEVLRLLRRIVLEIISPEEFELDYDPEENRDKPFVILVVGVNGSGKTTTIGKLAKQFRQQEASVLLVAADTFRAAAADQLEIWAKRAGCEIVRQKEGADPGAVAYEGVSRAIRDKTDVVIIDTAGRLHTKKHLMEEMKKVRRVIEKLLPEGPDETILVLDATNGQNAINQTRDFNEATELSALVMTKLDGTAKGGILVAIRDLFEIPIVKIGIGEGEDDVKDFSPVDYVISLFGGSEEEFADMLEDGDDEDKDSEE